MPRGKFLNFDEILSESERHLIATWAMKEFPRERTFKPMATKYRITHDQDGRTVRGILEYPDYDTPQRYANALNKKFPDRHYRVERVILPNTSRERILEVFN